MIEVEKEREKERERYRQRDRETESERERETERKKVDLRENWPRGEIDRYSPPPPLLSRGSDHSIVPPGLGALLDCARCQT